MILRDIDPRHNPENNNYESIAEMDRDNVLEWLKSIDGFSNAKGGIMYLGVEDKTNKLIGYSQEEIDSEKLFFYHEIKEHFDIKPSISLQVIPYQIKGKTRYIFKVTIFESVIKPLIMKYQGMPMIFMRRDGYTDSATSEEILMMGLHSRLPKFDMEITDIPFTMSEFTKLSSFYKENVGKELKEKDLAAIGFFDENRCLRKGALLFKDDYNGESTKIVCSSYRGMTRGDNEILASNTFQGNLIDSYSFMMEFVQQRMNHSIIKEDTKHIDYDAYPKRSLLEAFINALAHRDYLIDGTSIYVDLFKNRLSITSPGNLYSTGDIERTYQLDSFISKRRNELISSVFVLCDAMEAKGTGFEKIMDDYKVAPLNQKPYVYSKNKQFTIVLPDLTFKEGVQTAEDSLKLVSSIEKPSKHDLSILAFCYATPRSIKQITDYLNVSNSSFFRKNIISNLVEQKFLIELDSSNGKCYQTNSELVSRL